MLPKTAWDHWEWGCLAPLGALEGHPLPAALSSIQYGSSGSLSALLSSVPVSDGTHVWFAVHTASSIAKGSADGRFRVNCIASSPPGAFPGCLHSTFCLFPETHGRWACLWPQKVSSCPRSWGGDGLPPSPISRRTEAGSSKEGLEIPGVCGKMSSPLVICHQNANELKFQGHNSGPRGVCGLQRVGCN